ncbi:unnamed protein product [Urochloa humidicola]
MEPLLECLFNCYKRRATRRRTYIVVNGQIKRFQKHSQFMPDSPEDSSSNLKKPGYLLIPCNGRLQLDGLAPIGICFNSCLLMASAKSEIQRLWVML